MPATNPYTPEHPAEGGVRQRSGQQPVAQRRAHRLGEARQQAGAERIELVLGGEVHRHRDRDALGDVVDGDGEGQRHAHRRALQGREERCQPFREVVRSDGDRGQQRGPRQVLAAVLAERRVLLVQAVMRVGDEVVAQHDPDHAQQERQGAVGEAGALAIGQREGCNGLVEDLRQRHIHHRAAGEGQAEGQQARIGPAREQHQQAADGGGQTGREGDRERDPDVFRGNLQHVPTRSWSTDNRPGQGRGGEGEAGVGLPRRGARDQPPRRKRSSMAKHWSGFGCGGLKLTGTWMVAGTGWPLRVAALNCQPCTAALASSSSCGVPAPVRRATSLGLPSVPMVTLKVLVPPTPMQASSSGYCGGGVFTAATSVGGGGGGPG
ncbi:hypothetical protein G6F57_015793 [Rhizopus arrhizus]|nr:hypothetical protein G6F57_015793 [Rhizopus arrhizus]